MTGMKRQPPRVRIDHEWLDTGDIGAQTSSPSAEDDALRRPAPSRVDALIVGQLVARLDDDRHRTAVELTIQQGLTYAEAAELMVGELGYQPDPRTVWRWSRAGMQQVATWLTGTPWLSELMPGMPVEHPDDDGLPRSLDEVLAEQGGTTWDG